MWRVKVGDAGINIFAAFEKLWVIRQILEQGSENDHCCQNTAKHLLPYP